MNFLYLQIRWMGVLLVLLLSFALEQSAFSKLPDLEMTSPISVSADVEPEESNNLAEVPPAPRLTRTPNPPR